MSREKRAPAWYVGIAHQGKPLTREYVCYFAGPFPTHLAAEIEVKRAEDADFSTVNNPDAVPYGLQANLIGPASTMRKEWGLRDFAYGDSESNVIGTRIPIDPFELNELLDERPF